MKVNIVYNFQEQETVKDMLDCALDLVRFLKYNLWRHHGVTKLTYLILDLTHFGGNC